MNRKETVEESIEGQRKSNEDTSKGNGKDVVYESSEGRETVEEH